MFQGAFDKRVLGGMLVALFAAGIAITITAQSSSNTITACVNSAGLVRIIPFRAACLGTEQPIQWNISGPAGPAGPQGVPGEAGVAMELDVVCGTDTVGNALAQGANQSGQLTIVIHGVCTEAVNITRDDVTLRGAAAGDGLTAPDSNSSVVAVNGGQRVTLRRLTLQGGNLGINVMLGASVLGEDLRVTGAAAKGVWVPEGTLRLSNSVIEDSLGTNVGVGPGGRLILWNVTVQNGGFHGIEVMGGSADLDHVLVTGNGGAGVGMAQAHVQMRYTQITDNEGGMWLHGGGVRIESSHIYGNRNNGIALTAGTAQTMGVTIEDNAKSGIFAMTGSRVIVDDWTTIRGNGEHGIWLRDTSVVGGHNPANTRITLNTRYGIFCDPTPAVAQIQAHFSGTGFILNGTNVFGNILGDISCPGIVLP